MEFSRIVVAAWMVAILCERGVRTETMCEKFNIQGPCLLMESLAPTTTTTPPPADNPYCILACSQEDPQNFKDVCDCARVRTTTTVPPTTTPAPVTCYYGTQRPARLSTVVKRLYSPTPVATECDYPGVVGLFKDNAGALSPVCTASLLEEDVILINEQCLNIIKSIAIYAMANSYQTSSATKAVSVRAGTAKKLDPTGANGILYTIKLSAPLTFNTDCIQPVCVPNVNIPATDIDLNDCRVVGYGETTDSSGSVASQLMEVKVTVNPASVTKEKLGITRVDGNVNTPCFSDDGAPLICSHATTKEWITIGVITTIGFPCSSGQLLKAAVHNLLGERTVTVFYDGLQTFKYADPTVFAA